VCNNQTDGTLVNRVIAMEFDTKKSNEDALNGNYFRFDFNSIKSVRQYPLSNKSIVLASGSDVWVSIEYDGTSQFF
jgi:interleukin-1 receptor-associated kinase 1